MPENYERSGTRRTRFAQSLAASRLAVVREREIDVERERAVPDRRPRPAARLLRTPNSQRAAGLAREPAGLVQR